MNRRGMEDLAWVVILAILVIAAAFMLFFWINSNASGKLTRAQLDSKEAALVLDAAKQNTILRFNTSISLSGQRVLAISEGTAAEYSTFNPSSLSLNKIDKITEISVE